MKLRTLVRKVASAILLCCLLVFIGNELLLEFLKPVVSPEMYIPGKYPIKPEHLIDLEKNQINSPVKVPDNLANGVSTKKPTYIIENNIDKSENITAKVGGRISPDGLSEINCDLPGDLHLKNVGGSDGAGLCVFTSIAHSARWQNVTLLEDFRDWMRKHPGGGYPEKVDRMIEKCAKERNQTIPQYIQIEGSDLEILKLACKTGRMPGVTYSKSPTGRYGGGTIAHMVSLPHADDTWFCVLDNNYPGENNYEWMTPEEFKKTYTGGRSGWSVIFLNPPPPPFPKNPK